MNSSNSSENDFLKKLTEITEKNILNPQFGVSMLAKEIGISRSGLHRKVNSIEKISVSQLINQIRLKEALKMLKHTSFTVSEVAFKTGFSNTSYFIKCFHNYYGYTPGEVGDRDLDESNTNNSSKSRKKRFVIITTSTTLVIIVAVVLLIVFKPFSHKQYIRNKSIAILPFKNYSNDSINGYLIHGLIESINNNLSKIKDLRVISRTSMEKYTDNPKLIREIAKELNVKYLVEGSGQKYGDEIFLTIQLIDAKNDMHLWSKQYKKSCDDIISLQIEVSKNIAQEIQVIITPEENTRIEQIPTENKKAYNYYLKGMDLLKIADTTIYIDAISYLKRAVEEDSTFVLAYAEMAIANLYIYFYQHNRNDSNLYLGSKYADKALFYNNKSARALMAKGAYYYVIKDYKTSISYLEEALKYNSNSNGAVRLLMAIYLEKDALPNTGKLLVYAIRGVELNAPIGLVDDRSTRYVWLGNAFLNSGFLEKAKNSYHRALEINHQSIVASCGLAQLNNEMDISFEEKQKYLTKLINLDSTNINVLRICGLTYYWERDYNKAFYYFNKIIKTENNLSPYNFGRMAVILSNLGMQTESDRYMRMFSEFIENSEDVHKSHLKAMLYSQNSDTRSAIMQMRISANRKDFPLSMIRVFKLDPLYDNIHQIPEFNVLISKMETKFRENHKRVKASLENNGLLTTD